MSIIKYPFDRTAQSLQNKVLNETINLTNVPLKIILPKAGLIYTNGLIVKKVSTDTTLVRGKDYDYELVGADSKITSRTGYETASGIVLTDENATGLYSITYQCVGGIEGGLNAMFQQLAHKIENLNSSSADFNQIVNRLEEYPAIDHLHELKDLTGLNGLDLSLESIKYALQNRRVPTLAASKLKWDIRQLHNLLAWLQHRLNNLSPLLIDDILSFTNQLDNFTVSLNSLTTTVNALPPTIGKQSITILAKDMNYFGTPTAVFDPIKGVWTFEQNVNDNIQFKYILPKQWDIGNLSFKVIFEQTDDSTGSVEFGLSASSLGSGASTTITYGDETIISKAVTISEKIYYSNESTELVINNTPDKEDILVFKLKRNNDNVVSNIGLHGIIIYYNTDSNIIN